MEVRSMPPYSQYVPATPAQPQPGEPPRPRGRSPLATLGLWSFALASLLLLGLSGLMTWRWVDRNLLHWGIEDGKTTQVNSVELLERVRAFELATVKHTYGGEAQIDAAKVLSAGPARLSLPSWMAGQRLDVRGNVIVTAGVDLARVRPEDMQITRQGRDVQVVIAIPAPELLSAELMPNTMDMGTSQGLLTRIKTSVGFDEKDLRDRAADQLIMVAKQSALEQGILDEAALETERRLQAFLNGLPQTGDGRVTYVVVARPPAEQ
jgi:hypothetical protein